MVEKDWNRVYTYWSEPKKFENVSFNSPNHINKIIETFKDFAWISVTLKPSHHFCWQLSIAELRWLLFLCKELSYLVSYKNKHWRVIMDGQRNTTNGVHQHHFNYLNIHLFRLFSDILCFMHSNLLMNTRFQTIPGIWSQFIIHVFQSSEFRLTINA